MKQWKSQKVKELETKKNAWKRPGSMQAVVAKRKAPASEGARHKDAVAKPGLAASPTIQYK